MLEFYGCKGLHSPTHLIIKQNLLFLSKAWPICPMLISFVVNSLNGSMAQAKYRKTPQRFTGEFFDPRLFISSDHMKTEIALRLI